MATFFSSWKLRTLKNEAERVVGSALETVRDFDRRHDVRETVGNVARRATEQLHGIKKEAGEVVDSAIATAQEFDRRHDVAGGARKLAATVSRQFDITGGFFRKLRGGADYAGLADHPHLRRFGVKADFLAVCAHDAQQATAQPGEQVCYNPLEMYYMVAQTVQAQGELGKMVARDLFKRWKHGMNDSLRQMPSQLREQTEAIFRAIEDLLQ